MTSTLFNHIVSSPIVNETPDSITYKVSSRAAILALPEITGLIRDQAIIPNIPIKTIFSKSAGSLPRIVNAHLDSVDNNLLHDQNLLGLCLNGRGLDPEIFVHSALFLKESSITGYVFDDIFWHELLHAVEGIRVSKDGAISRVAPISYLIQQDMIETDEENKDSSPYPYMRDNLPKQYLNHLEYLRGGTPAQDNVSELFARFGNLFLQQIRAGALMPTTSEKLRDFFSPTNLFRIRDDKNPAAGSNVASEIIMIIGSFSHEVAGLLFHPDVYARYLNEFTRIYGYDYFADHTLQPA